MTFPRPKQLMLLGVLLGITACGSVGVDRIAMVKTDCGADEQMEALYRFRVAKDLDFCDEPGCALFSRGTLVSAQSPLDEVDHYMYTDGTAEFDIVFSKDGKQFRCSGLVDPSTPTQCTFAEAGFECTALFQWQ